MEQNSIEPSDELDLRELFQTLKKYKYSIIFITFLSTIIAFLFAYYKPNIYKSSATLQLESDKKGNLGNDILAQALNGGGDLGNLDTQKAVIKSRFLVEKVVNKLKLNEEYIGVNKYYKKVFFYKDSPIKIDIIKGNNLTFTIIPKSVNSFVLKTYLNNKEYKKEHLFNKLISTKYFKIKVIKDTNSSLDMKKYIVSINDPKYFAESIRDKILVDTPFKQADILEVSYEDYIPQRTKDFINLLSKEYLKQALQRKTQEATFTLKFVNEQLKKIKANLEKASKKLEEFKQKNKTIDVKESITQLSSKLAEYENQSSILKMKIDGIKNIIYQIKKGKLETLTLAGLGVEDQSIGNLIAELQQSLIKQKELLKDYTPSHPEVKKIAIRINQLKSIITKSINNILTNLKAQKRIIDKKLAKLEIKLKKFPKKEQNYIGLERNFLFNEKFYTYLMEKKTETEIKKAATISKNRILDTPLLPKEPIKPKRKLIIIVGLIGGLILGIFIAFLRAFLNDTIENESEIKEKTKAPFLGSIPKFKTTKNERKLIILDEPKSPTAEAFRNIRTNLQFMLKKDKGNVISITSTISKEGKTSIAANLAGALHLVKKRVILINLDLRKPTLHTLFDIPNNKGISNYLTNKASINEIIYKTKYNYIDIIPAGPIPPNPNELIDSKELYELINKLKREYDYIILDTPPIGLVSDTKIIIKNSDLTIFTLRANYSKKDFINLINELYLDKIHLAIVLNDISIKNKGYGYAYGYGYGYGGY